MCRSKLRSWRSWRSSSSSGSAPADGFGLLRTSTLPQSPAACTRTTGAPGSASSPRTRLEQPPMRTVPYTSTGMPSGTMMSMPPISAVARMSTTGERMIACRRSIFAPPQMAKADSSGATSQRPRTLVPDMIATTDRRPGTGTGAAAGPGRRLAAAGVAAAVEPWRPRPAGRGRRRAGAPADRPGAGARSAAVVARQAASARSENSSRVSRPAPVWMRSWSITDWRSASPIRSAAGGPPRSPPVSADSDTRASLPPVAPRLSRPCPPSRRGHRRRQELAARAGQQPAVRDHARPSVVMSGAGRHRGLHPNEEVLALGRGLVEAHEEVEARRHPLRRAVRRPLPRVDLRGRRPAHRVEHDDEAGRVDQRVVEGGGGLEAEPPLGHRRQRARAAASRRASAAAGCRGCPRSGTGSRCRPPAWRSSIVGRSSGPATSGMAVSSCSSARQVVGRRTRRGASAIGPVALGHATRASASARRVRRRLRTSSCTSSKAAACEVVDGERGRDRELGRPRRPPAAGSPRCSRRSAPRSPSRPRASPCSGRRPRHRGVPVEIAHHPPCTAPA